MLPVIWRPRALHIFSRAALLAVRLWYCFSLVSQLCDEDHIYGSRHFDENFVERLCHVIIVISGLKNRLEIGQESEHKLSHATGKFAHGTQVAPVAIDRSTRNCIV